MRRPRSLLLASLVASLSVLAGCGSSDNGVAGKSAAEIMAAARLAANGASSVHVTARSSIAKATSTMNASYAQRQSRVQTSLFNIRFEVIRDGGTLYVKGNRAFNAGLERRLGVKIPRDTWLKGSTTGVLAQMSSITDPRQELPVILAGSGELAKGARTKIDGQPAIAITQAHKLSTATLYVATTGKPYPLQLRRTGTESGQTGFAGWNDPVHVSAPASAVDVNRLERRGG